LHALGKFRPEKRELQKRGHRMTENECGIPKKIVPLNPLKFNDRYLKVTY